VISGKMGHLRFGGLSSSGIWNRANDCKGFKTVVITSQSSNRWFDWFMFAMVGGRGNNSNQDNHRKLHGKEPGIPNSTIIRMIHL